MYYWYVLLCVLFTESGKEREFMTISTTSESDSDLHNAVIIFIGWLIFTDDECGWCMPTDLHTCCAGLVSQMGLHGSARLVPASRNYYYPQYLITGVV